MVSNLGLTFKMLNLVGKFDSVLAIIYVRWHDPAKEFWIENTVPDSRLRDNFEYDQNKNLLLSTSNSNYSELEIRNFYSLYHPHGIFIWIR